MRRDDDADSHRSPQTGRVCVPLLASQVDFFDPSTVPTVGQLLMELEELSRRGSALDDKAGWERTSLKPYVELFEQHCKALVNQATGVKRGEFSLGL